MKIIYFSGTGNGLYTAKTLAELLDGEFLNISTCDNVIDDEAIGIVLPNYCNDIPAFTKKRLEEILNKKIVLLDFRITKSNKRENSECLQIQFLDDGDVHVLFTGSGVLIDQIQSIKDKLPLKTTVVKIDKYYSFS